MLKITGPYNSYKNYGDGKENVSDYVLTLPEHIRNKAEVLADCVNDKLYVRHEQWELLDKI